jgi:hypothetical protein
VDGESAEQSFSPPTRRGRAAASGAYRESASDRLVVIVQGRGRRLKREICGG